MPRSYSDETKAAALAALLQGQSVGSVAEEYDIPKGTLRSWKKRAKGVAPVATPKKAAEIGDLLVEYLKANLAALRAQAEMFGDKAWLKRQSAEGVAVLHGVMTDKAVRLLEAFGRAEEGDDGDD